MNNTHGLSDKAGVSVIISTYQRAHLVSDAIESALNQTLPPVEVIVIDDGSTDNTASVLKKYSNRIRYHYQRNRGVSAARNTGLSLSTCDYIAFLDSDDYWDSRKLEIQTTVLKKLSNIHLLFTDFGILKQDNAVIHEGTRRWFPVATDYLDLYDNSLECRDLGVDDEKKSPDCKVYWGQVFERMMNLPYGLLSSAIMRRSIVDAGLRFTEGVSLYEDWEFFARIAKSHMVGFLTSEMTFNRSHRGVERLTLKPSILKTHCYLGVLDRVWKSDPDFVSRRGSALRKLEASALLVLARDCALAGDEKTTRDALTRWRALGRDEGHAKAWIYQACASILYGPILLRYLLRARTLFKIVSGSTKKQRYSCAPT